MPAIDTTPHIIVSLLALGMALSFIVADRFSPTSRALSLMLAFIGISIATDVLILFDHYIRNEIPVPAWSGLLVLPEVIAFVAGYEWILRVRRTVPTRALSTGFADNLLRVAQAMAVLYGLFAIAWPQKRAHDFLGAMMNTEALFKPGFYLFAIPLEIAMTLASLSVLLLLIFRRPDVSERLRLIGFLVGGPFIISGLILPIAIAPVSTAIGLLIFLVGAVQYHVIQGRRAQFLSRFLSPQVAEMVRESGLRSAVEDKLLEITVVVCDLRGFTAFTKAVSSRRVIDILREYYDAVGEVAAAFGGTIKDQAGDGVLVLVGAPISFDDHAQRAVEMARRIRNRGMEVVARHSNNELELGVGIGVASGLVTVGVVGGASRLEYTAVGPPVNLASRLCDQAHHGEILIDERTAELIGDEGVGYQLTPGVPLQLKGYAMLVRNFILPVVINA